MNKKIIRNCVAMLTIGFSIFSLGFGNSFKALGNGQNTGVGMEPAKQKNAYSIHTLSGYKQKLSDYEFNCLIKKIYDFTDFINNSYPMHKRWFFEKLIPNIGNKTREILFITNSEDDIIALSALKNEEIEKKICTLYVDKSFQGLGLGSKLVENSVNFLGTTKPLVTFSEDKLHMFQKFISKYHWELCEKVNIYGNGHLELCYNGYLSK